MFDFTLFLPKIYISVFIYLFIHCSRFEPRNGYSKEIQGFKREKKMAGLISEARLVVYATTVMTFMRSCQRVSK